MNAPKKNGLRPYDFLLIASIALPFGLNALMSKATPSAATTPSVPAISTNTLASAH